MVTSRGELLIAYKIVRKGSLWSNILVTSHSNIKILQAWRLFRHLKAHKLLCNRSVYFFIILLQLQWPIESKFSQTFYIFYEYVGIHQVRRLVFDNYQRCPAPLSLEKVSFFFYQQFTYQTPLSKKTFLQLLFKSITKNYLVLVSPAKTWWNVFFFFGV